MSIAAAKEKLRAWKDQPEQFGKFLRGLAERLDDEAEPLDVVMCLNLYCYDLQKNVNGFGSGESMNWPYPPALTRAMERLFLQTLDQFFDPEFAAKVKAEHEEVSK